MSLEDRVLLLTPTRADAENAASLLGRAGVETFACRDLAQLVAEVERGAGALLVGEEALAPGPEPLAHALSEQPAWSDLPVLLLVPGGATGPAASRAAERLGNVVLLERPIRMQALLTAVRAALRARERQYEVRQRTEELAETARRKDEFLAMLAHELRNPLAPVRNGLELLKLAGDDPRLVEDIRLMMERQLQHMIRLVDDLLDVSRITRGKVELRIEEVDLLDAANRAAEAVGPLIEHRRHKLTVMQPGRPIRLRGDATRVVQVIGNLLNNAAKYTDEGGRIMLSIDRDGSEAVVRVRDNGAGISPEMLPRVFDLFTQVNSTLDRSQGGLGIGLTLVRSLVELHGGTVAAASPGLGRGSEFTVRFPALPDVPRRPAADDGPLAELPLSAERVLVVDDNADAAASLAMLLTFGGGEVRIAANGPKALELVAEFRPRVVLLDIGLPGMNGYELARRFRELPGGDELLLIAVTGYGQDEDRRRSREAGFDRHLIKPVDLRALQEALTAREEKPPRTPRARD